MQRILVAGDAELEAVVAARLDDRLVAGVQPVAVRRLDVLRVVDRILHQLRQLRVLDLPLGDADALDLAAEEVPVEVVGELRRLADQRHLGLVLRGGEVDQGDADVHRLQLLPVQAGLPVVGELALRLVLREDAHGGAGAEGAQQALKVGRVLVGPFADEQRHRRHALLILLARLDALQELDLLLRGKNEDRLLGEDEDKVVQLVAKKPCLRQSRVEIG